MKIKMSGKSYSNACAPDVSLVPEKQGWPEPISHKVGTGLQWVYEVDADQAEQIAAHLMDTGTKFMESSDQPDRVKGRAMLHDAALIKGTLPKW